MGLDLTTNVILFSALIVALTIHEFSHAWSASLLGDDYARRQGRVSLWPGRHLSLMGTLVFIVLHFGWGKPVPVNLLNFKNPKRDYLLTSLAGPLSNLLTIGVCYLLMLLTRQTYSFGQEGEYFMRLAHASVAILALISAILAVVNMLPVPPLDGSKIWPCIIPGMKPTLKPRTTWFFVIVLVALVYTDQLDPIFSKTQKAVLEVLPISEGQVRDGLYRQGKASQSQGDVLDDKGYREHAEVQWKSAEDFATQALEITPWDDYSYHLRSRSRYKLREYEDALKDIDRAIEISPDISEYHDQRVKIVDASTKPASQPKKE